jgi:hydrogenase maturation protease
MTHVRHVVVIGIGNPYRGDDGAALAVVEQLRALLPGDVEVVACEQEPTRLLEAWADAEAAVVVDAVASGGEPGALHRYDTTEEAVPARVFRSSTHAFGVGETIELGRALGRLPARVIVYGIEGQTFETGDELSVPVAAAVDRTVAAVADDVRRLAGLAKKEETCTNGR